MRKSNKKNIDRKIENMKTKLDIWRVRGLSLLGKCLFVKFLGITHLEYTASMLTIPNTYIPAIKSADFNFIWNNKRDKMKRDVMYHDYSRAGLRAPNIEILFKHLNLAWISILWQSIHTRLRLENQSRITYLKSLAVSAFSFTVIMTISS